MSALLQYLFMMKLLLNLPLGRLVITFAPFCYPMKQNSAVIRSQLTNLKVVAVVRNPVCLLACFFLNNFLPLAAIHVRRVVTGICLNQSNSCLIFQLRCSYVVV
jgi:hypothetical protein